MGPGTSIYNELKVLRIVLKRLQLTGSEKFANARPWANELTDFGPCLLSVVYHKSEIFYFYLTAQVVSIQDGINSKQKMHFIGKIFMVYN